MNKIQSFLQNNIPSIVLINEKLDFKTSEELWHVLIDTPLFPVKITGKLNHSFIPESLTVSLFPGNFNARYTFSFDSSHKIQSCGLKREGEAEFDTYNNNWEKIMSTSYKELHDGILITEKPVGTDKRIDSFSVNGLINDQKTYMGHELISWQKREHKENLFREMSFSKGYLSGKKEIIFENDLIKELKTIHSEKVTELSFFKYFLNTRDEWNICIQQNQIPVSRPSILYKRYLFGENLKLSDQDNLPDSRFSKMEKNNNYYFGEISKGFFEGIGLYRFEKKSIYLGNFSKNKYSGWGLWMHQNGSILCGNFSDGFLNGTGFCFNTAKQYMYEGDFINGQFDGEGKLYLPNGELYHALFSKNKRSNQGIRKTHPLIFR